MEPLKFEDRLTLTGEHISKEKLGIAEGDIPLHKYIENIERSMDPGLAAPAHTSQPSLAANSTPQIGTSKAVQPTQNSDQTALETSALNRLEKVAVPESLKTGKSRRFQDDASFDPRYPDTKSKQSS